jgi:hypothetical protein
MSTTLSTHHVETVLLQDGALTLDRLPFQAGQSVEVIIVPHAGGPDPANPYPLRGTPVEYDGPFDPVANDDWDTLPRR